MIVELGVLTEKTAARWKDIKIDHDHLPLFNRVAERLCTLSAKTRYEAVSAATQVPWWCVAVIHEREASGSWHANLAQGDPWDKVSVHIPRGQGPFASWEAAAI